MDEGRLLAADERARAEAELDLEVEAAAEDVLAEEPEFRRLLDGDLKAVVFLTFNIVLVLPYIKMNLPQVYMCSPS